MTQNARPRSEMALERVLPAHSAADRRTFADLLTSDMESTVRPCIALRVLFRSLTIRGIASQ